MAWNKLGTTTLSSAGSSIDITGMTANEINQVMCHSFLNGDLDLRMRLGNGSFDSGSNYSDRLSYNGGADDTQTSQTDIHICNTDSGNDSLFVVMYMVNIATEEKLDVFNVIHNVSTGAGTAPNRMEGVNKWTNTSNQFDYIQVKDETGSEINTDSNLSVLGSDGTESLNVQDGAIYYDTDLNKEYVLYNNTWTEV